MYGYVWLFMATYGYVMFMFDYVWLCRAMYMYGYVYV